MAAAERIASGWLVALQFGLIGALLLTSWPPGAAASIVVAALLLLAGTIVGMAALAENRLGNFNIRPELKPGARLASGGIYRLIRHPMYSAVLLAMLGALALDVQPWRVLLWLALLAVLIAKALREERFLMLRFSEYAAYRARTRRLLPWLW